MRLEKGRDMKKALMRTLSASELADENALLRERIAELEHRASAGPVAQGTAELTAANESPVTEVAQRRRALAELRSERRFLLKLIREHETDRQLIAYEIHDGLLQYASAALLHLGRIDPKREPISDTTQAAVELAVHLLRRSIDEGRRVMKGLRPAVLDEEGVVAALSELVKDQQVPGQLDIEFAADSNFGRLEPLLEGTIFRIVQEALNNIKRHSHARKAVVQLHQDAARVAIEVRDDGRGFDLSSVPEDRFGLEGIRKRAALLGGSAHIESVPNDGTQVRVELPLPETTLPETSQPETKDSPT